MCVGACAQLWRAHCLLDSQECIGVVPDGHCCHQYFLLCFLISLFLVPAGTVISDNCDGTRYPDCVGLWAAHRGSSESGQMKTSFSRSSGQITIVKMGQTVTVLWSGAYVFLVVADKSIFP